jgi:hypothetical protein
MVLTSCGGGGGGGSQAPQTTVSGTAAANVPIAGYAVDVLASDGSSNTALSARGATGPDGRYTATSNLGTLRPFLVSAVAVQGGPVVQGEPQYPRLVSVSHRGTANVTPLTSLLVARLLNRDPKGDIVTAVVELQNRSEADVSAARQQVLAYLLNRPSKDDGHVTSPVDVSAVSDFASMPLSAVPGDPHFEALRRFHDSLMDSETIQGVQEHMLFGNDPPADLLAILALDFFANCTVGGDGTMPSGTTRIVLDRRAITLGSFVLAFKAGGSLRVEAGASGRDDRWIFGFADGQGGVELNIGDGRLKTVQFTRASNSSRCSPLSEVSLPGKRPSLIALIGLLRQPIDLPRELQCAGPITFPGFIAAPNPNVLVLDPNGALRVNGPGGPSLHLPSMTRFFIDATLVVAGDLLSSVRLTYFSADRPVRGRFDGFFIGLTDAGQISGLKLDRENAQSHQTQSCGT